MKFAFIEEHLTEFPVDVSCDVLEVSRSGYYAWLNRPESERTRRREELAARIQLVHEQNRQVYGSPRVCRILQSQGESVCENTVADIMKERQIRAKSKRKFTPRTTDSRMPGPWRPTRWTATSAPNRKWAADITYVPTDQGRRECQLERPRGR